MGQNLNDSMANAIEDAYVLFAFLTSKYKESANCRKECEFLSYQINLKNDFDVQTNIQTTPGEYADGRNM